MALQAQLTATTRVLIGMPSGNEIVYLPAEIRHCQSLTGGVVEIGCRFEPAAASPPSGGQAAIQQVIASLLEQAQAAAAEQDECRSHSRVAFHGRVEIRGKGVPPIIGFARNLSRGGIALLTTAAVPLEERILMVSQPTGPPLGLLCRIVRCVRVKDGLYDIGASFLELAAGEGTSSDE